MVTTVTRSAELINLAVSSQQLSFIIISSVVHIALVLLIRSERRSDINHWVGEGEDPHWNNFNYLLLFIQKISSLIFKPKILMWPGVG